MEWLPLTTEEKHYIRSRFLFALGLSFLFLSASIYCAIASQETELSGRWGWLGGMLLALALVALVGRLALRMGRDLRKGEKRVVTVKVAQKLEQKGGYYIMLEGKYVQVQQNLYAELKKGDALELHRGSSGLLLQMQKASTLV